MNQAPRIKELLGARPDSNGVPVVAQGWVRTRRDSRELCFVELNDGSSLANLQVVASRGELADYDAVLPRLATGASLRVEGRLVPSPAKGQPVELRATRIVVLGDSPAADYPLQKKRHSFEFLREIAHLRPRTNTFGAVARVRNALSWAIHEFFQSRGFLYLNTPILTASDAEGAGAMFQVTTLPLADVPRVDGEVDYREDFFGRKVSLTVSGQLEAEAYACALGRVYTFGPTFRAEHSATTRHLAEFWMVEPEMAFFDIHDNMDLAEEFLKAIFKAVLERCPEDMRFFAERIDASVIETLERIVASEFARMTYTEAIERLAESGRSFEYPVAWGMDIQAEHERYLTEEYAKKPVILTDYPKEIKAFYMKANPDGRTVRAMDVLVPRLGEIIGGSQREDDYEALARRIDELGLPRKDYWWYLDLRRFGTVPHSGFGLGLERVVQFVTGMKNIRDVIPFPRAWREIEF